MDAEETQVMTRTAEFTTTQGWEIEVRGRVAAAVDRLAGPLAELAERDNVELTELEAAIERADIVLLLVDHDPFKEIDRELLNEKIVIDTKGLWR